MIKGGHLPSADIVDLLYDGQRFVEFPTERVAGRARTARAARSPPPLTAHLALGGTLDEADSAAQAYVAGAIRHAPGLGRGHGPMDHFWDRYDIEPIRRS